MAIIDSGIIDNGIVLMESSISPNASCFERWISLLEIGRTRAFNWEAKMTQVSNLPLQSVSCSFDIDASSENKTKSIFMFPIYQLIPSAGGIGLCTDWYKFIDKGTRALVFSGFCGKTTSSSSNHRRIIVVSSQAHRRFNDLRSIVRQFILKFNLSWIRASSNFKV